MHNPLLKDLACFCYHTPSPDGDFVGEDVFGETYGPNSTCLRQGQNWEKKFREGSNLRTVSTRTYGAGCYEVHIEI